MKPSTGQRYQLLLGLCLIASVLAMAFWAGVFETNRFQNQSEGKQSANQQSSDNGKTITYTQLPKQAQKVYVVILKGGPFQYPQDGVTFGNYERRLPAQARGYYREYTVKTPGVNHRGTRRIVCGGKVKIRPKTCYYTQDHYASFRQIVESTLIINDDFIE